MFAIVTILLLAGLNETLRIGHMNCVKAHVACDEQSGNFITRRGDTISVVLICLA